MWLINQKVKGIDPPATLTPDMIPPSVRSQSEGRQGEVSLILFLVFSCLLRILIPTNKNIVTVATIPRSVI